MFRFLRENGSALTLPFLGRTLDHMPGWKVARFVIPGLACACLLMVFSPNLLFLIVAIYALRLFGQGMLSHTAYTEIGRWFVANRGHLIELRGYNEFAFAAAFPIMALTTVTFSLMSGQLIDKFGAIRLLPFYLIPLSLASLTVALLTPVWGVYAFMLLIGVSYGFSATLIGSLWPEVYGVRNLGSVRALAVSASVAATAIGPGLTGYLIDRGIALPTQMI